MGNALRALFKTHESVMALAILILCVWLGLATDSFLTLRNLQDILTSNAYVGIVCAGLLVVLVSGGIDISFAATAAIVQYVCFTLIGKGGNWLLLIAMAVPLGAVLGSINAVLVEKLKINSIIVTVATMNVGFGLLMFFSKGTYISVLPGWFANGMTVVRYVDADLNTYRLNFQILLLVLVFVSTYLLLSHSTLGRQIYALGGSPDSARRIGLQVFGLRVFAYAYLGAAAALGGLAQAQLNQTIIPTGLSGSELGVLAAAVLGGASLSGGRGTVVGAFLGVMLLAIMQNGLVLTGVSPYWVQLFNGLVILLAAAATALRQRKSGLSS